MSRSLTCAGLILLLLTCPSCSRKSGTSTTQANQPTARYVEAVNTASGTFSIDARFNEDKQPSVINVSQAYARVVPNLKDKNQKDVLIVLVEKPLPRTALAIMEDKDVEQAAAEFDDMLHNRDARGLVVRFPADPSSTAEENIRPFFNGQDYDFRNLELELKSFATNKVEGHIKSNVSEQQTDINFAVRLEPDVWTGGTFYQQPPTQLSAGQASGQIAVDDKVVNLTHAYARLVEFDMFDETKNVFRVWLTEKPIDTAIFDAPDTTQLTDGFVLTYETTGSADRSEVSAGAGPVLDQMPTPERDYVRHDANAIEGRLYSAFPIEEQKRVYKVDVLFNAQMLPPAASDGPVTTSQGGEPLPADGGPPAKAYLAAMERMKGVKDFDEAISTWSSVVTKEVSDKLKQDVQKLSKEERQTLLELFAPLENPRLAGGLIKDNKATLRFTGTTAKGEKAEEAVNLHLEDGQWKIGRREIRVD